MSRAPRKPKKGKGAGPRQEKAPFVFNCDHDHIRNVCQELRHAGLDLKTTSTDTQCMTLLKVLQYRRERGLNTYEGTAAGYARIATRIQELEADGWLIEAPRENLIGPDGLFHPAVARYILIGRRADMQSPQLNLGLEGA